MSRQSMQAIVDESMRVIRNRVEDLRRAADRAAEALRAIVEDEDDDHALLDALTDAETAAKTGCDELARLQGIYWGYAAGAEREEAT